MTHEKISKETVNARPEAEKSIELLNDFSDSVAYFLDLPFLPSNHRARDGGVFFKLSNKAIPYGYSEQRPLERSTGLDDEGNETEEYAQPDTRVLDINYVQSITREWGMLEGIEPVDVHDINDLIWHYADAVRGKATITDEDVKNARALERKMKTFVKIPEPEIKLMYVENRSQIASAVDRAYQSLHKTMEPIERKYFSSPEIREAVDNKEEATVVALLAKEGMESEDAENLTEAFSVFNDFRETYGDSFTPEALDDTTDDPELLRASLNEAQQTVHQLRRRLQIPFFGGFLKRHS